LIALAEACPLQDRETILIVFASFCLLLACESSPIALFTMVPNIILKLKQSRFREIQSDRSDWPNRLLIRGAYWFK